MQVTIDKLDLERGISRAAPVADRKGPTPILQNVLLEAEGEGLRLAATDMYLGIALRCPAQVQQSGAAAVSAHLLQDIVRRLPEGEVSLSLGDGGVELRCGRIRYRLATLPAEEFPPLPSSEDATFVSLPASAVAQLIERTRYAMSTDETRPHLAGALFEAESERLRMVTTDGHRLALAEWSEQAPEGEFSMLVPHRGVRELGRLCDALRQEQGEQAELQVAHGGAHAFFRSEGLLFTVKLTEEPFPPYRKVIPQEQPHRLRLGREAFVRALERMALLSAQGRGTGGVRLEIEPGLLRICSENPELGEGSEELEIDYAGEPLTIGFNARYLLDALKALPHDEVRFELGKELDPGVLRPGPEDDTSYVGVIMPMRL